MSERGRRDRLEQTGRQNGYTASRPVVTRPPTPSGSGKQPLGRSEELLRRQEAYRRRYAEEHTGYTGMQPTASRSNTGYQPMVRPGNPSDPHKQRRKSGNAIWTVISAILLSVLVMLVLFLAPQLNGNWYQSLPSYAFVNGKIVTFDHTTYDNFLAYKKYMNTDAIYPGISIDGVDVSGMDRNTAIWAVEQTSVSEGSDFCITVNISGAQWQITSAAVPMQRNTGEIVDRALAFGRQNTRSIRGTGITPFRERTDAAVGLRSQPVALYTQVTYNRETIRGIAEAIADYIYCEPENASVAAFDFNTRSFTFNADSNGQSLDSDELYRRILSELDAGNYQAVINMQPEVLLASVTKAELMNSFKKVSSYTTQTTSNKNRNKNIELSAAAINGTTVLPGETFSFNQATGERTTDKGYLPAAAIAGGQSVDEVGGGVCQTSSTLFNAAARANLEIVKRYPHAWPSSYVEKGMDATVDWPSVDFKFKNSTKWPVFIVAYYNNKRVTVELYGMSLGEGITIDLESVVTKTLEPSTEINYVQNTSLEPGTQRQTIEARTGYEVETWQIWYHNGREIERKKLCKSTYKAYQATVEYN